MQAFLQRMMALCVASHYRNTPNDLILMSDAPAHHLFVLLGPVDETQVTIELTALSAVKQCAGIGVDLVVGWLHGLACNGCPPASSVGAEVTHRTAALTELSDLRLTSAFQQSKPQTGISLLPQSFSQGEDQRARADRTKRAKVDMLPRIFSLQRCCRSQNALPDVLAVVQVALEGAISRAAALTSLAQGNLPAGDLIPWTLGQQFQDPEFPRLSGARVVRIAVHPDLQRAGCVPAWSVTLTSPLARTLFLTFTLTIPFTLILT